MTIGLRHCWTYVHGGELSLSLSADSVQRGFCASSSSRQTKWNPTNHSRRPSTADASFQPINTSSLFLSFSLSLSLSHARALFSPKSLFSELSSESHKPALLRTNFWKSSEDHFWSPHYTALKIRDDTGASHTCSTTKQQIPASPNSRHLHFPLQQTRSCYSIPVQERQFARTVIRTPRPHRHTPTQSRTE